MAARNTKAVAVVEGRGLQRPVLITPARDLSSLIEPVLQGLDSPHSRRAYKRALEEFVMWWAGGGNAHSDDGTVDHNTVAAWRKGLVDGKLSSQSVNQRLAAVRAMVRMLAIRKLIPHESAAAVCSIKSVKAQGVRQGNWLTRVQVEKLLAAPRLWRAQGIRDLAVLELMLSCGLRRGDAAKLRGKDLAMVQGRWVLLNIVGKGGRVGTIPVASWAADAVQVWWGRRRREWDSLTRWVKSQPVLPPDAELPMFTRLNGRYVMQQPLGDQTISDIVKKYGAEIGLPDLAPHDLRRTFAQTAAQGKADMHQIQLSLRHASLATTNEYLGDQDLANAPCDVLAWDVPKLADARMGGLLTSHIRDEVEPDYDYDEGEGADCGVNNETDPELEE